MEADLHQARLVSVAKASADRPCPSRHPLRKSVQMVSAFPTDPRAIYRGENDKSDLIGHDLTDHDW